MSEIQVAYIYVLQCQNTNKVYVGSARNGNKRLRNHFNALRNGRHENSYLQRAWNKYGEANFSGRIIENCTSRNRWCREQYWIDNLRACNHKFGFNVMHSVQGLLPSPVMSKKLKAFWRIRWANPEYKKKRTEELCGLVKKPGVREKMQAAKRLHWQDQNYRELQSKKHKLYASDPKVRDYLRQRTFNLWKDPEYRAKQLRERKVRFSDPAFRLKLSIAARNRKPKIILTHNEIV